MTPNQLHEHAYIEEHNVAERYALGRLPEDECAGFEEHMIDCPACLDAVEAASGLAAGLRAVATEDTVKRAVADGLFARIVRSRRRLMSAALLVLAAAVPAVWLYSETARLRDDMARERAAAEDWKHRYEQTTPADPERERQLEADRERLRQEVDRLNRELAGAGSASPGKQPDRPARPRTDEIASVRYSLDSVRSGSDAVSIDLPKRPSRVTLTLDAEVLPEYPAYQVSVASADGSARWTAKGLKPGRAGLIQVLLPVGFLTEGEYDVTLSGVAGDGSAEKLTSYKISVRRK